MAATHLDMGLRCIKYLLCAVNALFVLTGIMIIIVGIKTYEIFDDFNFFLVPIHFSPATILIVVGILVFIISFFGCCGAMKESTCMVLVFAVSLSIVLMLEVAAAITAYALQEGATKYVGVKIGRAMDEYNYNPETKAAVDFMQSRLRCCGVQGMNDWDNSLSYGMGNDRYPESCCSWTGWDLQDNRRRFCGGYYRVGCIDKLSMLIRQCALNLGTAAMAIALIQLTGIMFALTLGRAIRRQKTLREKRRWELRENIVSGYQPLGKTDPQTMFPVVYMQPEFPEKTPID